MKIEYKLCAWVYVPLSDVAGRHVWINTEKSRTSQLYFRNAGDYNSRQETDTLAGYSGIFENLREAPAEIGKLDTCLPLASVGTENCSSRKRLTPFPPNFFFAAILYIYVFKSSLAIQSLCMLRRCTFPHWIFLMNFGIMNKF